MRIVRFDAEVGYSRPGETSGLRVGSLVGDGTDVRVEAVYLPSGCHRDLPSAATRRLLGVVAGTAWASGAEAKIRELAPGYGAVFEAFEGGSFGAAEDVTAIVIEGAFEVWAVAVTKVIVVADYDPAWPEWFDQIRRHVGPAVADVAVRLDHVGSTAVPGLAAKPVIDLDVVVATDEDIGPGIDALAACGYRWKGNLGVAGREAFSTPPDSALPAHHLYLVVDGSRPHLDHVLLRDLLRRDDVARDQYGALKRRNAREAEDDMDRYVAAKAAFVASLLTRARTEAGLPAVTYWDPSGPSRP